VIYSAPLLNGFIFTKDDCSKDYFELTIKGGNGCRFHVGHVQKEVAEVRKLISDFPKEQLEVIKDCLSTNVGSGAAGALLKKGQG
jgi:hypothetical protein